jgi:hypothetical protein
LLLGQPRDGPIERIDLHLQLLKHHQQRLQLVLDTREQARGPDAFHEVLRFTSGNPDPLSREQRLADHDHPGARAHQGLTDRQL